MSTVVQPPASPRKRRGLPRPFVALCIALGVVTGAYTVVTLLSLTTASTEHRTRTFAAVRELRIAAGDGDVTVVGERRRNVRVEMEIQRGMWRGAWQPHVRAQRGGRGLQLESHCSVWAHIGVGDCGASYTVHVPRGTRLVVDASSGDVRVAGVERPVAIDASSGDVHVEDVAAPLRVGADSGDVHVEGYRGTDASVQADSGDVDVVAQRAPRRLRAVADSGDIDLVVPDRSYRVTVQTDSGDQDVQVRQDPDASRVIEARADSGDVAIVRLGDGG
jgi:hypothetical protein